jgi:hypothetical protein
MDLPRLEQRFLAVKKVEEGSESRRFRSRPNKVRLLQANAKDHCSMCIWVLTSVVGSVADWPQTLAVRFS